MDKAMKEHDRATLEHRARLVLDNKTRSHVEAAREFAGEILGLLPEIRLLEGKLTQAEEHRTQLQARGTQLFDEGRALRAAMGQNLTDATKRDVPAVMLSALGLVVVERWRQMVRWNRKPGEWKLDQHGGASTPLEKLAVLSEEHGEVAREVLERGPRARLIAELEQLAA